MARGTRVAGATPAAETAPGPAPGDPLSADALRTLLGAGTTWLDRNADAVNALNVFPVPDGDTGTNMLLTMRAAVDALAKSRAAAVGPAMRAVAQGAIMGARGNSGVILSQIISGLAKGMEGAEVCDGPMLARALAEGANTAYRAVTRPVEGTILTVARAAGETATAAAEAVQGGPASCDHVLAEALAAARAAVERTPEQLSILRQAGVVDAGAEGYRLILEGMLLALRGQAVPEAPVERPLGAATGEATAPADAFDAIPAEEWGYCTQFVIRGADLDVARIRDELQGLAESALVVGDETLIRVHGHAEDPGQLLTYAVRFGRLQRISIEDMDAQHDEWLRSQARAAGGTAQAPEQALSDGVATVAVAPGEGFAEVFRSLGAAEIVAGGQTMNPSANDLLAAARRTGKKVVVVLPNNGNVVMTAQQAAMVGGTGVQQILVVPTKTVPQGLAAQLAFDAGADPEEIVDAMSAAAGGVRTVEITRATRTVTLDGVDVARGDVLGLLDDKVVAAGTNLREVTCKALEGADARGAEVITVYHGVAVPEPEAAAFAAALRDAYPKAEIQLVPGGQPHYDYVISVE
jgi:DAK2 domain fusion protein YloV